MSEVTDAPAPSATKRDQSGHGSFTWYELMTTDPESAGAFYSAVVPGWRFGGRSRPTSTIG